MVNKKKRSVVGKLCMGPQNFTLKILCMVWYIYIIPHLSKSIRYATPSINLKETQTLGGYHVLLQVQQNQQTRCSNGALTLRKALLMEVEVSTIWEVSVPSRFAVNLFFKNLIRAHSNKDTLIRKFGYISNPHFKIIMNYDQWHCNIKTTKTLRSFQKFIQFLKC